MTIAARHDVLERNLLAIAQASPAAAERVRAAAPRPDVEFAIAPDGGLTAWVGSGPTRRLLASARAPLAEARDLADAVPVESSAAVVMLGFGVGHHGAELARRLRGTGVIIGFEPDLGLLRAVLERADHSAWMRATGFALVTDAEDAGAMGAAVRGSEALVAMGVRFVQHPSGRARLGPETARFTDRFTAVVRTVRTTLVTTLVQVEATIRNLLMNLDHYATAPGVADLAGAAEGRPAIVVSAGPSLRRNIDLLARPGVRDRFVIVAAQTVLRPLLDAGVRPHFVTALDYHEISRRFYEGLRARDVAGVTLVAEPKANPAILDAFPGLVRCPGDETLDQLLGPGLARPMGHLPSGATVAHLAYYLARHLACDPVILIGQDLGFTDGQYYAAGAAIHRVWAGELNPFRSLEALEWERIVRGRANLVRATDTLGRPIYTDEQLATYLVQFEREFLADTGRGLRVIDATEGGVSKRHTRAMALRDAIAEFGSGPPLSIPDPPAATEPRARRIGRVAERVRSVRADVGEIAECSRATLDLLAAMLARQDDRPRVNRLIADADRMSKRVTGLRPAFGLVQHLNQTGTLNRFRADRAIALDEGLTPLDRQRRQIERDVTNVTWIRDAADQTGLMLDEAHAALNGAPKATRDPPPRLDAEAAPDAVLAATPAAERRVAAIIPVELERGPLGTKRDLAAPVLAGRGSLALTLARLARGRAVRRVVLVTDRPEQVRAVAGSAADGLELSVVAWGGPVTGDRGRSIAAGRRWAADTWRGGLGGLSVYDEVFWPAMADRVMRDHGIDAALVLGPDWCLVDPDLSDALVDRYREQPTRHRLTFTQAAPGLAPCVVDATLARELASQESSAGPLATLGAALGYVPIAPRPDPIARGSCVPVALAVRDLAVRAIADSDASRRWVSDALAGLSENELVAASAAALAERLASRRGRDGAPRRVTVELCTGRRGSGDRAYWASALGEPPERPVMPMWLFERVVGDLAAADDGLALSLAGAGDPLQHPGWRGMVERARELGVASVHVRTDLLCPPDVADALLAAPVDVISVDLLAWRPETYRRLTGLDGLAAARANLDRLIDRRRESGGLPHPWLVPRITRCDAVYEEIEPFYDHWLLRAGAAAIDPLPRPVAGQRIDPLPRPPAAEAAGRGLAVLSDGAVTIEEGDLTGSRSVGNASQEPIASLWARLGELRRRRDDPASGRGRAVPA